MTFLLDKRDKLIFKPTHDPAAQTHQTFLIQARRLNASAGCSNDVMTQRLLQTQNKQPVCFSAAAEGFIQTAGANLRHS